MFVMLAYLPLHTLGYLAYKLQGILKSNLPFGCDNILIIDACYFIQFYLFVWEFFKTGLSLFLAVLEFTL